MYASELKGKKRSDNVEGRGNAWLKRQPLHIRQAILGVKGEQEWKAGRAGWMEKARNISPVFEKKESRLFDLILQLHATHKKNKFVGEIFSRPEELIIPKEKLYDYCLNKNHPVGGPKAVAFEKYLGYTQSDYKKLENLIRENIDKASYEDRGINNQGHKYGADFFVDDLKNERILLTTGWIIDNGTSKPRLTTSYLKPEIKEGGI